jgi:hypothetical protein
MNYSIRHWVRIINKLNPDSDLRAKSFRDDLRMDIDMPKKLPAKRDSRLKLAYKILRHIDLKAAELVDERIKS